MWLDLEGGEGKENITTFPHIRTENININIRIAERKEWLNFRRVLRSSFVLVLH
jgi:hypothetical protein